MAVRNLYWRIYLTVVAVLLVFALVVGLLVQRHAEAEYNRIESAVQERTVALADLLARNLPSAAAPDGEQGEALLDWARRLRLTVALEASDGRRIAATPGFYHFDEDAFAAAVASPEPQAAPRGRARPSLRVALEDGRTLIVGKVRVRPRSTVESLASALGLGSRGSGPRPDRPPPFPGPGPDGRDRPGFDGERRPPPPDHDHEGGRRPPPPGGEGEFGPGPAGGLAGGRLPRWLDESALVLAPLAVLFIAIALGSYPVVRRLTRRLEALQRGVEAFGAGQLSQRVSAAGNDEVAVLAASFNRAAERIEELVRANRSLLANASHELRSPLARLKMAVEMMETADAPRRLALKQEVDRDVRELDALVEEVLLASRLDAHTELALAPVDLVGLAADEAARVGAQLSLESPESTLSASADERLLRRALRNLLENARRYAGDDVVLTLRRVDVGPGGGAPCIELVVGDRGPGVPPEQRERIFEPFYRLPGHSERAGGVGLGLSLVRQIAQRHGGSVRCEARPDGGSLFIITLPVSPA